MLHFSNTCYFQFSFSGFQPLPVNLSVVGTEDIDISGYFHNAPTYCLRGAPVYASNVTFDSTAVEDEYLANWLLVCLPLSIKHLARCPSFRLVNWLPSISHCPLSIWADAHLPVQLYLLTFARLDRGGWLDLTLRGLPPRQTYPSFAWRTDDQALNNLSWVKKAPSTGFCVWRRAYKSIRSHFV